MSGFTDYSAKNLLGYITGAIPMPAFPAVWLGLFQVPPTSDAGTGGTEVPSTNAYARVQVAGTITAGGTIATTSATITMGVTNPGWVVAGMNVYDTTNSQQIGTVQTYSGTTLTLTANAAHAGSGSTDVLAFSAFGPPSASSGNPEPNTLPASTTNGAVVTFPQATGTGWGTTAGIGLFDAASAGNLLAFDYLGNFKWIPFSCSSGTPGTLTVDSAADVPANGSICAVTQKYGGTLPTTAGSWAYPLTSAGASSNQFNLGVNTTSVGGGLFRQVLQQAIAGNVTASFNASTLTISAA